MDALVDVDCVVASLMNGSLKEHVQTSLELKESWSKKHGVKLSALANRVAEQAAWLVVGVADEGVGAGRDEKWAKQTEEVLSQQIARHLDPPQACEALTVRETDAGWIVAVKVLNPGDIVYWEGRA